MVLTPASHARWTLLVVAILVRPLLGDDPAPPSSAGGESPESVHAALDRWRRVPAPDETAVRCLLESGTTLLDRRSTDSGRSPADRCRDAFLGAEMHRLAARALRDEALRDEAIRRARALRVEHLALPQGALGYVAESRALRDRGDLGNARAALEPILGPSIPELVRRLAEVEALEITLMLDPAAARDGALALGPDADWVRARSLAELGESDAAATLTRSTEVQRRAPAIDRLALLARLGALTDEERAAHAIQLVGIGRGGDAIVLLDERCPPESSPLLAELLADAGRSEESLALWRRSTGPGASSSVLMAAARSLALRPGHDADAADLYLRVAETDPVDVATDRPRRVEALRQYASLVGHDVARAALLRHPALVEEDPFLRYVRAAGGRRDDPAASRRDLDAVLESERAPAPVRAAATLLRAELEPDPRRSLAMLDAAWTVLRAEPLTDTGARRLRTRRWIELGMVDDAADAMLGDPPGHDSRALLDVATALVDRRAGDGTLAATDRATATRLATAAIGRSPTNLDVGLEAGRLLIRAGAASDAARVLRTINHPDARALRADAAIGMGRVEEALDLLADDRSTTASLLRGRAHLAGGDPAASLEPLRAARRSTAAGSEPWWVATIHLARAQLALGQLDDARAMVRTARVLHPVDARHPAHAPLEQLHEELQ